MEVLDFFKKTLSFGIGTAVFSAEKLKDFADEMVQKGEMSKDDAKKFVDDVSRKAEDEKSKMQDWMKDQVAKVKTSFAEVDRVKKLEERVALLESKLGIEAESSECCCQATGEEDPEG